MILQKPLIMLSLLYKLKIRIEYRLMRFSVLAINSEHSHSQSQWWEI